ncbi:hypothetical protein FIBSPDRAFT_1049587 [Athelia psychrophila]|uniref:Uncharacterized protein n=1 Tax=Athelia psychrophila TaxID=1759441 RepID=A0A166BYX7_9AGAM|nr:hypothetical protein FIBSPDRAFT_1049587 [Fibularhizoctonia sp. CBS 109695]
MGSMLGAEGSFALSSPPPSTQQVLEKPEKPRRSEGEQLHALMLEMLQWVPVSVLRMFHFYLSCFVSNPAFQLLLLFSGPTWHDVNGSPNQEHRELQGWFAAAGPEELHVWLQSWISLHDRECETDWCPSLLPCPQGFPVCRHVGQDDVRDVVRGYYDAEPMMFLVTLATWWVFVTVPRSDRCRSQHRHRCSRRTVVHPLTNLLAARLAVVLLVYRLLLLAVSPTLDALANPSNSSIKEVARYTDIVLVSVLEDTAITHGIYPLKCFVETKNGGNACSALRFVE